METTQNMITQDPLGLQRFALTESAYDLVNSIRGAYGRLSYAENLKDAPDQNRINQWRKQSKAIGRAYRKLTGEDLSAFEVFIENATNEWNQVNQLANERILVSSHVS